MYALLFAFSNNVKMTTAAFAHEKWLVIRAQEHSECIHSIVDGFRWVRSIPGSAKRMKGEQDGENVGTI